MLTRWGGRPGKGGGFDSNHRPVVGFFDRFNGHSSNILLTFSCYFEKPQHPRVGHLNGNSQHSSNAPPMPGLPPQRLNIDRCIICSCWKAVHSRHQGSGALDSARWIVMHQSIPAENPPPGQPRGICSRCQSRGWGIRKFIAAPGAGH